MPESDLNQPPADISIDQYAVFGNPVQHSKSPTIHQLFAEQTGQTIEYKACLVPEKKLSSYAKIFFVKGGKGCNITVPFKLDAFVFADELTPRAQQAGAVNTLALDKKTNKVSGDNTDGVGLVTDITQNLTWEIRGKKILILGAGGAVRGVLGPLLDQQPQNIIIANRTAAKAVELGQAFGACVRGVGYDSLVDTAFDVIINGTSASLSGDLPPLGENVLRANTCCYDMMYAAELTPFLQWAQQRGMTHLADGLGMLVEQAAESFSIWRGVKPDTAIVIDKLREELAE